MGGVYIFDSKLYKELMKWPIDKLWLVVRDERMRVFRCINCFKWPALI